MMIAPVVGAVTSHSANLPLPVGEEGVERACSEAFDTDIPSFKAIPEPSLSLDSIHVGRQEVNPFIAFISRR
jgi:hypothetical protein